MEGDIGQRVQELVRAGKQLEALEMLETTLQQAEATEQTPGLSSDLCELCNSVGMCFLNKGDMTTSLDLLKRAESLCDQRSNLYASVLNNLACYYRKLGKARTALVYLDKAREIEATAPSPKSVANTHLNYCAILSELGKHDEALTHIMKAVIVLQEELMSVALGRDRPAEEKMEVLAVAYHNLAVELEFQKEVRPI
jgi:tetratricopeptide (TPR) repeat protein